MKKLICAVLTVLLFLGMTGCSAKASNKTPEAATEDFFKAIKKGDQKLLDKVYIGETENDPLIQDLFGIINETETLGDFGKILSENILEFQYDVSDVTRNGDSAVARVNVKSENWEKVIENLIVLVPAKVISMSLDGKSEKQIEKAIKELVKEQREKVEDVVIPVDINLIDDNGEWKIDLSNETGDLINAVTGGLY